MAKLEDAFLEGLMADEKTPPPTEPPAVIKEAPSNKLPTSKSIFSHPDAHPVALDMVLLKNFDLDWLQWLPETLFTEIEETFKTSIANINRVKILAAQTLHVTDAFWNNWEIFEKTIWALNGTVPQVKVVQPPDLSILFAGVDMANSIRKEEYGEEVARYSAAVFLNENVLYAPDPLDFAQIYLSDPYYICKDCDKKGSALPPFDGRCSSCAGHYETDHPFSFKPDKDLKGEGKNVEINLTYDPDEVKHRFDTLDAMPADKVFGAIKETTEDIQAAKLIIATDYMKSKAEQLANQIKNIRSWLEAP